MNGELALTGPVGVRTFHALRECDAHEGHEHNYDHAMIIIRGRVRVLYRYLRDGQVVEGESREFGQGEWLTVKADVRHTVKPLEDDTLYACVFSHRDFGGLVTQEYNGNLRSYEYAPKEAAGVRAAGVGA